MITCNNCGNSLADDLRFCTECGSPIRLPPTSQDSIPTIASQHFTPASFSPTEIQARASKSSHMALIVMMTVVATVLLLIVGGLAMRYFFPGNAAERGVQTSQVTPTDRSRSPEVTSSVSAAKNTPSSKSIISSPSAPPTANTSSTRQEVIDTLENWAAAIRAHDLDSHMTYYAETLHTYYLKHNVSSVYVRETLEPAYTRYYKLDVRLSNIVVSLDPTGTEATATLDKTYTFEGDRVTSASGEQMLWLSKATGRWLITGIRDVRVYYKK